MALAILNSAAMNIEMSVSFLVMFFSGYMPRSGTAGLYGNSIYSLFFNLFFNCKKLFYNAVLVSAIHNANQP